MDLINNNIDLNTYKVFLAVTIYGSFKKASDKLFISQPAVSYTIKKLEEELGTKLFVRMNKGVRLTEQGQHLKFHVENAFRSLLLGYTTLNDKENELMGTIKIGIHSNVSTFLLPKYVKEFSHHNPKTKIIIYSSTKNELKEMFETNALDILILHSPIYQNSNYYTENKLITCDSCFFGVKKYYDALKDSKDAKNLLSYPLLLPLKGYSTSISLDKVFKNHNLTLSSNIYLYTTEMTIALAKNGTGIGWTLKESIKEELENKTFYEIPVNLDLPKVEFSMAYNPKYINKASLEFVKYLLNETNKNNLSS